MPLVEYPVRQVVIDNERDGQTVDIFFWDSLRVCRRALFTGSSEGERSERTERG